MADNPLAQLLQIEQQVRRCESPTELYFVMVNDTRGLTPYDQGGLLLGTELEKLTLVALSDTPLLDRATPFAAWLERCMRFEDRFSTMTTEVHPLQTEAWREEDRQMLADFSPPFMLWVPLMLPAKPTERLGVLWLAKSSPWTEKEIGLLKHLASSYAHALQIFSKKSLWGSFKKTWHQKTLVFSGLAMLVLVLLIPVRLSVLAPAEVAAKAPAVVTAPLQGAIKEVLVVPGQSVNAGTALVLMEDTELKGALEVAQRDLFKAQAELRTAQQAGFADFKAKGQVSELSAQVALKTAERDFAQSRLHKAKVTAKQPGLVILNDPKAWQGRPVAIGEKILLLANPAQVELKVMLPVRDAVSVEAGSEMVFFLDTDPLNPIQAKLRYSVYEPELTPEQIVAYKVVADFSGLTEHQLPRIGLRGTAKLYGQEVTLFYYLFRRPITAVRQWLGW